MSQVFPSCVGSEEHEWEVINHHHYSLFPHVSPCFPMFPQKFRATPSLSSTGTAWWTCSGGPRSEPRAGDAQIYPVTPVAGQGFKIRLAMVSPKFDDLHWFSMVYLHWFSLLWATLEYPHLEANRQSQMDLLGWFPIARLDFQRELVKAGCWSRGRGH